MTNKGSNNTIFSGDRSKQLSFDFHFGRYGRLIAVTDFESAKQAIQEIIAEGEGSSPCNPLDWSNNKGDLSHYFLFKSIVERHKITISNISEDTNSGVGKKTLPLFEVSLFSFFFFFWPATLQMTLKSSTLHRWQKLVQCAISYKFKTACNLHLACPSIFACFTCHVLQLAIEAIVLFIHRGEARRTSPPPLPRYDSRTKKKSPNRFRFEALWLRNVQFTQMKWSFVFKIRALVKKS